MRRTLELLRAQAPWLEVDGEMHGDVALDGKQRAALMPRSTLEGGTGSTSRCASSSSADDPRVARRREAGVTQGHRARQMVSVAWERNRADETLHDLLEEIDGVRKQDRQAGRPPSVVLRKLDRALDEFATYVDNNAGRVASRRNVTRRLVVVWSSFSMFNRRLWACGRRLRRWATQPRSGALSTVAAGAPQAHRPYVHSLPGAKRPAPSAPLMVSAAFRLRPALHRPCADRPGPFP